MSALSSPTLDLAVASAVGLVASSARAQQLLEVRDLGVHFDGHGRRVDVISALSYEVVKGETLAIIGESGSGKSLSCRTLLGLLPVGAVATGSVLFDGIQLCGLPEAEMRARRGRDIAMVFQDSERALNPTMRIGEQILESIRAHQPQARRTARTAVLELLDRLRLPNAGGLFYSYPHELSGGMRQRVVIAMAIAANPRLLIADEPTASLDVSTAAEVMGLLLDLKADSEMALILVSHDLRLVENVADSILVMRNGRSIEYDRASQLIARPRMRYTQGLLEAVPRLEPSRRNRPTWRETLSSRTSITDSTARAVMPNGISSPLLEVRNVVQDLGGHSWLRNRQPVRAICNVSFSLMPGEILALVGESGAGKSTLVRTILQMPRPVSGSVLFRGHDMTQLSGRELRRHLRHVQVVFQDPYASVNPKWRVREIVEEPLVGHNVGDRVWRKRRVAELLDLVRLPAAFAERRPRQLSVGQCQRVAIARALALEPQLLICDEAVSSLDAIVQKEIAELFLKLRIELGIGLLFISHDLALVREISDRVAVMHMGRLCEIGPVESVCRDPLHPQTGAMLEAAMPLSGRRLAQPLDASRCAVVSSESRSTSLGRKRPPKAS